MLSSWMKDLFGRKVISRTFYDYGGVYQKVQSGSGGFISYCHDLYYCIK